MKGAGRSPLDEEMEIKLMEWIDETYGEGGEIDCGEIKKQAREMCRFDSFRASQGWLKNFLKRTGLEKKYVYKNNGKDKKSHENRQQNESSSSS